MTPTDERIKEIKTGGLHCQACGTNAAEVVNLHEQLRAAREAAAIALAAFENAVAQAGGVLRCVISGRQRDWVRSEVQREARPGIDALRAALAPTATKGEQIEVEGAEGLSVRRGDGCKSHTADEAGASKSAAAPSSSRVLSEEAVRKCTWTTSNMVASHEALRAELERHIARATACPHCEDNKRLRADRDAWKAKAERADRLLERVLICWADAVDRQRFSKSDLVLAGDIDAYFASVATPEEKCPNCNGDGYAPLASCCNDIHTCRDCSGTGAAAKGEKP